MVDLRARAAGDLVRVVTRLRVVPEVPARQEHGV
jgi:hypothetical protein